MDVLRVRWFLRRFREKGFMGTVKAVGLRVGKLRYQVPEKIRHMLFLELHPELKQADRIKTSLTSEEKRTLFWLASRVEDGFAVEVGSYLGASACFISAGLKGKSKLICVDTWMNDAMDEERRDTFDEFIKNTRDFREKIIVVRGRSDEVFETVRGMVDHVGLLFIDGDHSYKGCKIDWELYSQLIRRGGYVILHDCGWAEGVQRVIQQFVKPSLVWWRYLPNMFYGVKA